jgi:hypothetical protein
MANAGDFTATMNKGAIIATDDVCDEANIYAQGD